ncbi:thermonuclease family protein [Candidatus Methylomirabilis sp.]|uniref:thermonuclease family protein n=1 Tax=Candidatus Methylomirabilis sp. TaxID=2032687 RepID=UPI0030761C4C
MRRTSAWIDRTIPWRISRRRLWVSIPVLVAVLFCAACNAGGEKRQDQPFAPPTPPPAPEELVRVKRVYDGDTILLEDDRTVRYLGINAPEYQEPFYLKAKRFNESLVLGLAIRLEFDQEKSDGRDRLLAYVYAGDQMVNARLIQEGLAHAFFIGPNRKHNALLLRLQAEAKQRKVGIWSSRGGVKDLKITTVHPTDPTKDDRYPSYVRIASLSNATIRLADYALSNEGDQRCRFPDVSIDPGYTVIASSGSGSDGVDSRGQMVVHCSGLVWDEGEDTAFLKDPAGNLVDTFHYKGKRVRRSASRSKGKVP